MTDPSDHHLDVRDTLNAKIDQHTDGKPDRIHEEVLEAGAAVVAKNLGLDAEETTGFTARMVIRWEWDDKGPFKRSRVPKGAICRAPHCMATRLNAACITTWTEWLWTVQSQNSNKKVHPVITV